MAPEKQGWRVAVEGLDGIFLVMSLVWEVFALKGGNHPEVSVKVSCERSEQSTFYWFLSHKFCKSFYRRLVCIGKDRATKIEVQDWVLEELREYGGIPKVFVTASLCVQSGGNVKCLELMQAKRHVGRPFGWFWGFQTSGEECRVRLLARQRGSKASIHGEAEPLGRNREDESTCVTTSVIDWFQCLLFVLSAGLSLCCGHQVWYLPAEFWG